MALWHLLFIGGMGDRVGILLNIFETPCDCDPATGNSEDFKFFQTSLKLLNVYFGGDTVYGWGIKVYSRGLSKICERYDSSQ